MRNRNWNIEELREAIKQSRTLAETLKHLGLSRSGTAYKALKTYIEQLNIDTSHWMPYKPIFRKTNATIEEILVINSPCSAKYIRNYVIKNSLVPYVCACCGISEWQGNTLTLQLDHTNGDNTDNRLDNLRFLCPNCHSQTLTWGFKG